jgi:hypothetical protein
MGWRIYGEPYRRWRDVKDLGKQPSLLSEALEVRMNSLLFRESRVPGQLCFIAVRARGY